MAQKHQPLPIDVLTFFENGRIDPIKFRLNGRVYPVKRIYKQWKNKRGDHQMHHFLIQSEGQDSYELRFDSSKFTWKLYHIV